MKPFSSCWLSLVNFRVILLPAVPEYVYVFPVVSNVSEGHGKSVAPEPLSIKEKLLSEVAKVPLMRTNASLHCRSKECGFAHKLFGIHRLEAT